MNKKINLLVSIIIPTKNCPDTIERAVLSVLNQTYENVECIIVDYQEENTHTFDAIKELLRYDHRLKYIKSPIANLGHQRNLGVLNASGEYIVFLDGDDALNSKYVEIMIAELIASKCDIVCCSYRKLDCFGNKIEEKTYLKDGIYSSLQILKMLYGHSHSTLCLCTCKLAKKSLYQNIPINEEILNEDEATTYRHFASVNFVKIVNLNLYDYYTGNPTSLSNSHLKNLDVQVKGLLTVFLDRYLLFKKNKNRRLIWLSYFEMENMSLSYAFVFKNKNLSMKKTCLNFYKDNFKFYMFLVHPFAFVKIILKYFRAK